MPVNSSAAQIEAANVHCSIPLLNAAAHKGAALQGYLKQLLGNERDSRNHVANCGFQVTVLEMRVLIIVGTTH